MTISKDIFLKGNIMKKLNGNKLAGGNPSHGRVDNDFYATDPKAVKMLLNTHILDMPYCGISFLEPCVGQGHIAEEVKKYFKENKDINVTVLDLIDRGYPNTEITDYLTWQSSEKYDLIITNPPYSLAKEFVEKSMKHINSSGKIAMFLKIQFLEGQKRKELFEKYPPKYIYVFRNRMATWNNGQSIDPSTGKKWATTMCHAWFIWEKGSKTEPIIRWL